MRKIEPFALKFIVGILIILFNVAGCSDMPHTGSIFTVNQVDRYLVSTDGNVVCFQDDLNETCLKLTPETRNGANAINTPIIYIYPEKRVYLLYHEGRPIFRAVRAGSDPPTPTGDGPSQPSGGGNNPPNGGGGNNPPNNGGNNPPNGGGGNNPPNDNNPGDDGDDPTDDGHGWIIWIYYPEGTAPQDSPTLSESGVTITINGKQLTDDDITGFAQFIGPNNEAGIQFFYPTQSAELLDLKVRMKGISTPDGTARFNINYLWNSQ